MHEAWATMTKYKSASFCLHPAVIFTHLSSPILKTSCRDSIFKLKVSKGLLKPWQMLETQAATAMIK